MRRRQDYRASIIVAAAIAAAAVGREGAPQAGTYDASPRDRPGWQCPDHVTYIADQHPQSRWYSQLNADEQGA